MGCWSSLKTSRKDNTMTKFKEYAKQKTHIRFEEDYSYLPYYSPYNHSCIEGVGCWFYDNKIIIKEFYTSITMVTTIDRNGNIEHDFE